MHLQGDYQTVNKAHQKAKFQDALPFLFLFLHKFKKLYSRSGDWKMLHTIFASRGNTIGWISRSILHYLEILKVILITLRKLSIFILSGSPNRTAKTFSHNQEDALFISSKGYGYILAFLVKTIA
jgi:hypothetical protein